MIGKRVSELAAADPTLAQLANLGGNSVNVRTISAGTGSLLAADNGKQVVLSASSATILTISAGVCNGGFTASIVDLVGGGSIAVTSGVTLLAPNGSASVSAGALGSIVCPADNTVVFSGFSA